MLLKPKNLKRSSNYTLIIMAALMLFTTLGTAQDKELIIDEKSNLEEEQTPKKVLDTTKKQQRFRVDGIVAVIGDNIVLDSDIDKMYMELQAQEVSVADVSRCQLFGKLLEDKLYAHHAVEDSLVVNESEIYGRIDQQIQYMTSELGSEEKVYEYYNKTSMEELRKELFEVNKTNTLAQMMQEKIFESVEVTPEEVRQFFYSIPEDERPVFGAELEVAQIVIEPEITDEARKEVVDQLWEFRRDVLENDASFTSKAVLYSQDPGSATKGGLYTMNKGTPFVKEFKDIAFTLQEGEISEPFETEFGFHILKVDKVRGQERDIRHILLIPEVSEQTIAKAKEKIDNIRQKIIDGEISFAEAARTESDEKETRNNGGQLINPTTEDTRFELNKMDPTLSSQVYDLKDGEVSKVYVDENRNGRKRFKIMTVTNRYEEHAADYKKDYEKIKELALTEKKIKAVEKWQEKKIKDTYINISKEYGDCEYANNWMQN